MAELKTKQTNADVNEFIKLYTESGQKRKDSFELLKLMRDFTGFEPKMGIPDTLICPSFWPKSRESKSNILLKTPVFR